MIKSKLLAAGISGDFHKWIVNYLSDRIQYVEINGARSTLQIVEIGVSQDRTQYVEINRARSTLRIIEIGVLQGLLLGPRLYTIYANDLSMRPPG